MCSIGNLRRSFMLAATLPIGICLLLVGRLPAGVIFASGQNNGDPTHASGNHYYSIDINTGVATPISPQLSGSAPAGLASVGSQIVGFKDGQHGGVDPHTGIFTPNGSRIKIMSNRSRPKAVNGYWKSNLAMYFQYSHHGPSHA